MQRREQPNFVLVKYSPGCSTYKKFYESWIKEGIKYSHNKNDKMWSSGAIYRSDKNSRTFLIYICNLSENIIPYYDKTFFNIK